MRIKILTINIWNRSGPWDERCKLLRAGIEALAPDVIGMQEVMANHELSLADEATCGLGYTSVFGEAKALSGGVSFGNAALSRWPLVMTEVVQLPSVDTDEQRSLLMTEVTTPEGVLPFLVTHLAWKFHHGYVREQQVMAIAAAIRRRERISRDRLPVVMVGDFNARPDATEIRFIGGLSALGGMSTYFADCYEICGDCPGYTFDARVNPFAAPTQEPPRRIDYVFVRGPDKWRRGSPVAARVVLNEVVDGVAPSDHFGVLAEIDV
jgi:endonuclease/exonuclease/phosphatase family metal-dependent hydrolase